MKMREYYDATEGVGAWDRMHDAIERKEIFGWNQPKIEVDGSTVHVFPGENREVTLEEVKEELRRVFAQVGGPMRRTH